MRIVLFCENKYAVDILHPIQIEADKEGGNETLWYVHKKKISDFPLKDEVRCCFQLSSARRSDGLSSPRRKGSVVPCQVRRRP